MPELICTYELCKYCSNHKCENPKVKKQFENIDIVTKVILSVSLNSCKGCIEEEQDVFS